MSSAAPQVIVEAHPVATLEEPPEEKKKDPAPPVPPCKAKKKGATVATKSIKVRVSEKARTNPNGDTTVGSLCSPEPKVLLPGG